MVGTSGIAGFRLPVMWVMMRNLLAFARRIAPVSGAPMASTSPLRSAALRRFTPRGTRMALQPVMFVKMTAVKCVVLPVPAWPILSVFGFFLQSATKSLTVFHFDLAFTRHRQRLEVHPPDVIERRVVPRHVADVRGGEDGSGVPGHRVAVGLGVLDETCR